MSDSHAIALTINGEEREALVNGRDTLLTVLRDKLHLTGTKRGCNQGVCGLRWPAPRRHSGFCSM